MLYYVNLIDYLIYSDVLRQVFNIHLNFRELAAIVHQFDTSGTKEIHCANFMLSFQKLGQDERFRIHSEMVQKQRELDQLAEEERKKKMEAAEAKAVANSGITADFNFTPEDKASSWEKFKESAFKVSEY